PWKPNVAWQNMRIASSRTIQTSSTLLATALASAGQFEDSIFIAQGAAARSRTGSDRAMVDCIERVDWSCSNATFRPWNRDDSDISEARPRRRYRPINDDDDVRPAWRDADGTWLGCGSGAAQAARHRDCRRPRREPDADVVHDARD